MKAISQGRSYLAEKNLFRVRSQFVQLVCLRLLPGDTDWWYVSPPYLFLPRRINVYGFEGWGICCIIKT